MKKPANLEMTLKAAMFIVGVMNEKYGENFEVNPNIEEGSFDLDMNGEEYDGGSYTVDGDGTIRIWSIGYMKAPENRIVGNVNECNETKTNMAFDRLDTVA